MRPAFRGKSVHKVDGKGRVSIPASFRVELRRGDPEWSDGEPPRFILVHGQARQAGYLECYTIAEMARLERKIRKIPTREARENAVRMYITESTYLEVDPNGRIVLPKDLRELIGAEDELLFLGHLDTFRIALPEVARAEEEARRARMIEGDPGSDPLAALDLIPDEDDE
ncbi:division/cell wall cluster transcriptional repressor MraZ [Amaricoccus solimangrovi]|uniref:division/cell wall cluster transcriptional repressor MraZ n=1 Tax=Amaricoccus solimangrovi TaxID=2589815 RepID=UPI0015E27C91|nr:cell division/cell wall cluster transcriptional repressor MraZ [Amaricoccus solimangrovi]